MLCWHNTKFKPDSAPCTLLFFFLHSVLCSLLSHTLLAFYIHSICLYSLFWTHSTLWLLHSALWTLYTAHYAPSKRFPLLHTSVLLLWHSAPFLLPLWLQHVSLWLLHSEPFTHACTSLETLLTATHYTVLLSLLHFSLFSFVHSTLTLHFVSWLTLQSSLVYILRTPNSPHH